MSRNLSSFVTTHDNGNGANNDGRSSDFEEQPEMTVIRPKDLGHKIADALALTVSQSFARGYVVSGMRASILLRGPRTLWDADSAFGQIRFGGRLVPQK